MRIPVHGGADIRVAGNSLQCFDVQVRRRHRDICVPEHMRRSPMHVDCSADSFPTALVGHLCDRKITVAQDICAITGQCRQDCLQLGFQRNQPYTGFTLGRADVTFVAGKAH